MATSTKLDGSGSSLCRVGRKGCKAPLGKPKGGGTPPPPFPSFLGVRRVCGKVRDGGYKEKWQVGEAPLSQDGRGDPIAAKFSRRDETADC